ncbi:MAG: ATP-dependent DNA helicase RecG [Trichlorobacter sp.]|nr:ATP-dependent DNA helicase RecG [Trichlorobacter sp.]
MILHLDEHNRLHLPKELLQKLALQDGDLLEVEFIDNCLQLRKFQQLKENSAKPPKPETTCIARQDTADSITAPPVQLAISQKNLQNSIRFIKGVGPKMLELLAKKDIATVEDALFCLPLRYEDRRQLTLIRNLQAGRNGIFHGTVQSADSITTKGGRRFFEVIVTDGSGSISLKWFRANQVWMQRIWKVGRQGIFSGEISSFGYQREVHHPDVEWLEEGADIATVLANDSVNFGRIVPVYPLTEGLQQKAMRRIMAQVLEQFLADVANIVPPALLPEGYLPLREALGQVHNPPDTASLAELDEGRTKAHRSLAFDEFFFWELGMALKKKGITLEQGISFQVTHRYTRELARLLPFKLTKAQRRVLTEIKEDMIAPHPMHRLVQGDVGSGKTIVALMAALVAVENSYQVAIMAPTEILAEQHWHNIHHWCEQLGITVLLLTAAVKGQARKDALAQVASGQAAIIIGTHAVIQDKVEFHRLGLGIVDEQHRFGVLQRGILRKKGQNPDILVMTATPIPRTLAMTLFGDLSLSVIDELPPGRTPIDTRIYYESRRSQIYELIREEVKQGRQAYLIYPLVEESEKSDLRAASQMAEQLQQDIFPDLRVGLLHGRMKPEEKETVMAAFKAVKLDILVATTVIEVGIDVPNATMMVVEHAERFGLSQLHQLRGRVGRGAHRSCCILLASGALSDDGRKRLQVMESTNDGFMIAEADLEIRGPGDFLGTRQSGMPDFRVASVLRDGMILEQAQKAAARLLTEDSELISASGKAVYQELVRRWGSRLELAAIA